MLYQQPFSPHEDIHSSILKGNKSAFECFQCTPFCARYILNYSFKTFYLFILFITLGKIILVASNRKQLQGSTEAKNQQAFVNLPCAPLGSVHGCFTFPFIQQSPYLHRKEDLSVFAVGLIVVFTSTIKLAVFKYSCLISTLFRSILFKKPSESKFGILSDLFHFFHLLRFLK